MQIPDWLRGLYVSVHPDGDEFIKISGKKYGLGTIYHIEKRWPLWPDDVQRAVTNASIVQYEDKFPRFQIQCQGFLVTRGEHDLLIAKEPTPEVQDETM